MPDGTELLNVLGKFEKLVSSNKDSGANVKNWWRWPLVIVLVLASVAVFAWIVQRKNGELAKLRHEKRKREIAAEQALSDAKVAKDLDRIKEFERKRSALVEKADEIDEKIREVEDEHKRNLEAIDSIRTWDDVATSPSSSG